MALPETVTHETVTPEWLNTKLGITTISSISIRRIGENQGFTDPIYRIHLHHNNDAGPGAGANQPKTLVLKVADPTITTTDRAAALAPLHAQEVLFYHQIAPVLRLAAIPQCYHASFNAAILRGSILLEDMGAPIHQGSVQLAKATIPQATRVMAELGRFQGTCLARRAEGKIPGELARPLEPSADEVRAAFPGFAETWRPFLGEEVVERYRRAVDRFEGEWVAKKGGFLQGLVHGDFRLGNVLFCYPEGGREEKSNGGGDGQQPGSDRNVFERAVMDSIATRHVAGPGQAGKRDGSNQEIPISVVGGSSVGLVSNGGNGHAAPSDAASHLGTNNQGHEHDAGNEEEPRLSIIDWQTVSGGPAVFDVAYFMAMSIPPETRRTCELDLVYAWYKACREAAGAAWSEVAGDYGMARCVREISTACIAVVLVSVTRLNHFRAPDAVMRAVGGSLKEVSEMLVDWELLDKSDV
jgi:thiamine kinase-like enzyme